MPSPLHSPFLRSNATPGIRPAQNRQSAAVAAEHDARMAALALEEEKQKQLEIDNAIRQFQLEQFQGRQAQPEGPRFRPIAQTGPGQFSTTDPASQNRIDTRQLQDLQAAHAPRPAPEAPVEPFVGPPTPFDPSKFVPDPGPPSRFLDLAQRRVPIGEQIGLAGRSFAEGVGEGVRNLVAPIVGFGQGVARGFSGQTAGQPASEAPSVTSIEEIPGGGIDTRPQQGGLDTQSQAGGINTQPVDPAMLVSEAMRVVNEDPILAFDPAAKASAFSSILDMVGQQMELRQQASQFDVEQAAKQLAISVDQDNNLRDGLIQLLTSGIFAGQTQEGLRSSQISRNPISLEILQRTAEMVGLGQGQGQVQVRQVR